MSATLTEDLDQHKVVMVGTVVAWRTIITKKGDPMGFITLEDVQGTFECVAFPKTWKQTQTFWQRDKIVLVRGRVDGKGRSPKVLLDSATDNPQVTRGAADKDARVVRESSRGTPYAAGVQDVASRTSSAAEPWPSASDRPQPSAANFSPVAMDGFIDDPADTLTGENDPFAGERVDMLDAPPTEYPNGIQALEAPSAASVEPAVSPRSMPPSPVPPSVSQPRNARAPRPQLRPAGAPSSTEPLAPRQTSARQVNGGHGSSIGATTDGDHNHRPRPARIAKVIISRSGDGRTDAARVGEVHRLMRSFPGVDHFCFIVSAARGHAVQLDFPNDTTDLNNEELLGQLRALPGVESVQISFSG